MTQHTPSNEMVHVSDLIDEILSTHHENTRRWMKSIQTEFDVLAETQGKNSKLQRLETAFRGLKMTMQGHMEKEEMILFPACRALERGEDGGSHCGGIENPIRVMHMEHEELEQYVMQIREITKNFTVDSGEEGLVKKLYKPLEELVTDIKVHAGKEEERLFPAAIALEKKLQGGCCGCNC